MNREQIQEQIDFLPKEVEYNLSIKSEHVCKLSDEIDVDWCLQFNNCIGCQYLKITSTTTKEDFEGSTEDDLPW